MRREPALNVRRLGRALFLFPLVLLAPACEDLPPAPEIPNVPPVASFIFNPVSPITAGETPVVFNATGSRDSDGAIATYSWSWGDGTPDQATPNPTISHVFADTPSRCVEVTYAVLLTVSDDKGGIGTASQQVKVTEAPAPTSTQCR
jgi:PKD repeat protein